MTPTSLPTPLLQVPARVCMHRTPFYGCYQGTLAETDLSEAAGFAQLRVPGVIRAKKRWQWFCAMDEEVAFGGAVVRLGYMGQCFFWVFDRSTRQFVTQQSALLPPGIVHVTKNPQGGTLASTGGRGVRLEVERPFEDQVVVSLDHAHTKARLVFKAPLEQAMTAICPLPDRRTNVTIKHSGVHVQGWIQASGGRRWEVSEESGWGFLDYTHGLLPYHTTWKWAIGGGLSPAGERVGFNLIEGFNQGYENAMWHQGRVYRLPESTLSCDSAWTARSSQVALRLQEEGVRREAIDLKVIASRYVQPLGRWTGEVGGMALSHGVGVAEEHEVRW